MPDAEQITAAVPMVMFFEIYRSFTGAVVREQHETESRPPAKRHEAALGLLNSVMTQAKAQRGPDTTIPLHRWHPRLRMTPEELKVSLKTLRLSQVQFARCISVSPSRRQKMVSGTSENSRPCGPDHEADTQVISSESECIGP
jgi:hypothetical protein